jgi:hypothetical protein
VGRIHVDELVATVQAATGDTLSAATLRQIVTAVVMALDEQTVAARSARRDTRITGGVAAEEEAEEEQA